MCEVTDQGGRGNRAMPALHLFVIPIAIVNEGSGYEAWNTSLLYVFLSIFGFHLAQT